MMKGAEASLDTLIAVGFGSAYAIKDYEMIYDGERDYNDNGTAKTIADIEDMAVLAPGHDWRVVLFGPLSGATYHRQGVNKWVCVECNDGFA